MHFLVPLDESTFLRTFDWVAVLVAPQTGQGNLGSFNAQLDARAEMGDIAGARGRLPGNARKWAPSKTICH